jgi:hypothetical protein
MEIIKKLLGTKWFVCINSGFVILRLDRGIYKPVKRLDSPIESENDGLLDSQLIHRL